MSQDLMTWALPRLQRLLPIDDDSLREVLTYTTSLSKAAGAEHLKNMLGDSTQAFEFISAFNARREDIKKPSRPATPQTDEDIVPRHKKTNKKSKPPLHNAGPVRRPEGYGDVAGGYQKQTNLSNSLTLSSTPDALQLPIVSSGGSSRQPSPGRPAGTSPKPPPSAAGNLISDLPNVRTKQAKKVPTHSQPQSGTTTPSHHLHPSSKPQTTTTTSIADLTSAIASLELMTNPTLTAHQRRKCPCNASIHPLFTTAPNCLSCGKIICALEGLQPCSFCSAPILSRAQVSDMITALKQERGVAKTNAHNASTSGRSTPMFSPTPSSARSTEVSDAEDEAASRARAHRDRLLGFQRENAQRTKVHDEAADFDMTLAPGATQWMSPVQRAAALKKQQAYLREVEEMGRPEWERKRTVMSIGVKNGKVVRSYERVEREREKEEEGVAVDEEVRREEEERERERGRLGGTGAFSRNPLLGSGGMVRPVWKPKGEEEGKGKGVDVAAEEVRAKKSIWRKVQDDNEDNEKWILDGGLHGYGTETRLMEDGSQQERG